METQAPPTSSQSSRDLSKLLLGHYVEMLPAVGLTFLCFLFLPRQIEWLALLPLGALYGAAAARMLDIRREPLAELAKQRLHAFAFTLLAGMIALIAVFFVVYVVSLVVALFTRGREWAGLAGLGGVVIAGIAMMKSQWPRLGMPFVYDGYTDNQGRWSPPPFGPLKELLQRKDIMEQFTNPLIKLFVFCVGPYVLAVFVLPSMFGAMDMGRHGFSSFVLWIMISPLKIAFVVYLLPLFMLSLVQTTRGLAAIEGAWVEAAEVVEAPPAMQAAAWSVEDDGVGPVAEVLDDASDKRVKVYDFEKPSGPPAPPSPPAAPQYSLYGAQAGGPSPTPPGVAVPAKSPPAMTGGPRIEFPSASPPPPPPPPPRPPEPSIPPKPVASPPAAEASIAPTPATAAPKTKTAKDFALDELEDVAAPDGDPTPGGGLLDALLAAIDRGDEAAVRVEITRGLNPNALDADGRPLLHRAVAAGAPGVIEALIASGANLEARDGRGRTALLMALMTGSDDLADRLLQRGASPRAADSDGLSALHIAIAAHLAAPPAADAPKSLADLPIIRHLLNSGADAKAATLDGETALHIAARRGDMDFVNALFFAGADVNAAMSDGTTPLQAAVRAGHDLVAGRLRMWGAKE